MQLPISRVSRYRFIGFCSSPASASRKEYSSGFTTYFKTYCRAVSAPMSGSNSTTFAVAGVYAARYRLCGTTHRSSAGYRRRYATRSFASSNCCSTCSGQGKKNRQVGRL